MIDTLSRLARANTPAREIPELLTQLAGLALSCGGDVEAATLAREALYCLPETPSATRSQALRELGTALICQEQTAAGLALLDDAVTMAASANAPGVAASALCRSGMYALNHGDYSCAEHRFRRAIELLGPPVRSPHALAVAHAIPRNLDLARRDRPYACLDEIVGRSRQTTRAPVDRPFAEMRDRLPYDRTGQFAAGLSKIVRSISGSTSKVLTSNTVDRPPPCVVRLYANLTPSTTR
ncbi:MAG: hypothetical protein E6J91_38575 [Deltaproteobacteria bacterium]|nr:MAG: hypothetical protein E6J91_38575 [Deltaproteobacteria bacterium]